MRSKQVPPTRILMIDLDLVVDASWLMYYRRNARVVLEQFGLRPTTIRITPSRKNGYHARVYLNRLVPRKLALMIQWFLLDDARRTDFNRGRVLAGFDQWNKLFEDP